MANYIRFDWAMKRLLRDKANFSVLEGLLTTLLNEKITIRKLLESESNQESGFDKYDRVDILAEDSKGTLILFEIRTTTSTPISSAYYSAFPNWSPNTSTGEKDTRTSERYTASISSISP